MILTLVKRNYYTDSIFLMMATSDMMDVEGVKNAVVVMGSDIGKSVLKDFGALTPEAAACTVNDLIIAVDCEGDSMEKKIRLALDRLLVEDKKEKTNREEEVVYHTLSKAKSVFPDANIAVISLPGEFAGAEAMNALQEGMHCFIFSDNVPLEMEVALKKLAKEKGLLVMGPGCGVSIINNVSLGLMSKVRRGPLGIVGASGSGIHEIVMLAHRSGVGISQAIGTGGRDLSRAVGGITMLQGLEALENDPETKVIVLVSKPPHPDTMARVLERVRTCKKPVIIYFLGSDGKQAQDAGAYVPHTLEEAADMAVCLCNMEPVRQRDAIAIVCEEVAPIAREERAMLSPEQKYIRGVFCGGTHSEESVILLKGLGLDMHSNLSFGGAIPLKNPNFSEGNCLTDMGDETFTKGRLHPVIDPAILAPRLLQEANDPETAVILFDVLIGYGAHKDPVGCIEKALNAIRERNRYISLIASLCGTDIDPQGLLEQCSHLEVLGVRLLPSNAHAALCAGLIVRGE